MKKFALGIAFYLLGMVVQGQMRVSLPFSSSYDEEAVILVGLQYSYIYQNYRLSLQENWESDYAIDYTGENVHDVGSLKGIHSANGHNFAVGIPVDVRVDDNLYFTFNPTFQFINNSGISFSGRDPVGGETSPRTLLRRSRHISGSADGSNFNSFEFPFSIKFRSDEKILKNKINRYRGYLIGGARVSRFIGIQKEYELLLKERENSVIPQSLILQPSFLSWEVGIGADIFFPYFKMSPEIKFNQSFGSILDHNHALSRDNKFMAPIEKAWLRSVYISLIFQ
ncbi:PorT [Sphingobacterium sp. SGG-5]|uniref:PorT n=1 Tax=Sphingobacterium sp. SGG-5 TaxID=2710881 RepID=UPI0013EA4BDC|nr:PorT [Sphingobacterium sp. SGG-5]NGM62107.1 PorT [Sphingobacterium sp. SGG-5]